MPSLCSLSLYLQGTFPVPCQPSPGAPSAGHPLQTPHSALPRRSAQLPHPTALLQKPPQAGPGTAALPSHAAPGLPRTTSRHTNTSGAAARELLWGLGAALGLPSCTFPPPAAPQGPEPGGVVRGVQPPRGQLSCGSSSPPALLGAAPGPVTSRTSVALRAAIREPRGTAAPAPLRTVSQNPRAGRDLGRADLPRTPRPAAPGQSRPVQNPSRAAAEPPPAASPLEPQPTPAQQHAAPTCAATDHSCPSCGPGPSPPADPHSPPAPLSTTAAPVRFSRPFPGARALQEPLLLQVLCPPHGGGSGGRVAVPGPTCRCMSRCYRGQSRARRGTIRSTGHRGAVRCCCRHRRKCVIGSVWASNRLF